MSGLKQFYLKHIRVFTIILVLIAAFVIYKCWQKKQEVDKQKEVKKEAEKKEYFYDLATLSDVAFHQGRSATGEFDISDFAKSGIYSRDPAFEDVIADSRLEIGESGVEQKTKSSYNLPTQYGSLYESDLPAAFYLGADN